MSDRSEQLPPFPAEALQQSSELERILFLPPEQPNPLRFESLPPVLHAAATEAYANWIGQLQFASYEDEERLGRGSVEQTGIGRWQAYFSDQPVVGHQHGVNYLPYESDDWLSRQPRVDTHSHGDLAYQGKEDMEIFLDHLDFVTSQRQESPKIASIVAGAENNTLFLATADSKPGDWLYSRRSIHDLMAEVREAVTLLQRDLALFVKVMDEGGFPTERVFAAIRAEERDLFAEHRHINILTSRFINAEIARRNQVGFYISNKDGVYYRDGVGLSNDGDSIFRAKLAVTLDFFGVSHLPNADFLARMDQRLTQNVSQRARLRSLGLALPGLS